jgi:hypothetical protein
MDEFIFSLTLMVIIHLAVDENALVQLALT